MKCITCNQELSTGDINNICLECKRKEENFKMSQCKMPELVTESYPVNDSSCWIAYLKDIPGMVTEGKTEEEAINKLMISIRVKMLYNRDQLNINQNKD